LNCGTTFEPNDSSVRFNVCKTSDILNVIIPFFDKYPIIGNKRLDYEDFCKVAYLVKDKTHLTSEGIEVIKSIKARMNTGRK
jgi:hypothetical protein